MVDRLKDAEGILRENIQSIYQATNEQIGSFHVVYALRDWSQLFASMVVWIDKPQNLYGAVAIGYWQTVTDFNSEFRVTSLIEDKDTKGLVFKKRW